MVKDFCKKSKQRKVTDFIKPESHIPARVDPDPSTSASSWMGSDPRLRANILSECLRFCYLGLETNYPYWGFRSFPQSLQANYGIVSYNYATTAPFQTFPIQLFYTAVHPRRQFWTFQFIVHLSPFQLTLYSLSYWKTSLNKLRSYSLTFR
jgi:hypothetical protein